MGRNNFGSKVLPGTRVTFVSSRQRPLTTGTRGIVCIPLIGHAYGNPGEFIEVTGAAPNAAFSKLGYDIYADVDSMLLIREALKNAHTVLAYVPAQGAAATATNSNLTGTARAGGSRGNTLTWAIIVNPIGGFDVIITLDGVNVSLYEGLSTVEELIAQNDEWIEFKGTGPLTASPGVTLSGGETPETITALDMLAFFDAAEPVRWNTMALPIEPSDPTDSADPVFGIYASLLTKIRALRDEAGRPRKAVVPYFAADYQGIINLTNSVRLNGKDLTVAQTTAWVAGLDAGASMTQSNTYAVYHGAENVINAKDQATAIKAVNNGEFFFIWSENGEVIVQYDINSLTTFEAPVDETYRKNRVLRVFDTFSEWIQAEMPPNRFSNSEDEWGVMEGIGRAGLLFFAEQGAIQNVNLEEDFIVDRSLSKDDKTYFIVGLQPVDSAEKLFFTVRTR